VERFPNSRQLASYLGLNPREHSRGGRQRLGAISQQGNCMMRGLLVEAAPTAAWLDPELRRPYQRLKFRRVTCADHPPQGCGHEGLLRGKRLGQNSGEGARRNPGRTDKGRMA